MRELPLDHWISVHEEIPPFLNGTHVLPLMKNYIQLREYLPILQYMLRVPCVSVPLVGRELAEAGNTPLPAVDHGQRGVSLDAVVGNGELPVLGGSACHLVDAPSEGLGPVLLLRSTDAGLPLIGRHLPRVRGYVRRSYEAMMGKKSRSGNVATRDVIIPLQDSDPDSDFGDFLILCNSNSNSNSNSMLDPDPLLESAPLLELAPLPELAPMLELAPQLELAPNGSIFH